jgi:hypothetical protein
MASVNDDFVKPTKDMTKEQRKQEKYSAHTEGFSVKECSNITDGVVRERKVTDFFCLVLFLAFFGAMGACTMYGFKKGDVEKYVAPLDRNNHFCGIDAGFEDYPKLFLTNLIGSPKEIFASGVCVKTCPKSDKDTISCEPTSTSFCSGSSVYDTNTVLGYCMPNMETLKEAAQWTLALNEMMNSNPAGRQIQDLYLSSRAIYWSMGMSFVYCLLFIYLMSLFAEYIAWAIVVLIQIGLFGATAFFMGEYLKMKDTTDVSGNNVGGKYMVGGIVSGICSLVFLCCVWCGFNSLKTAIDVIDASADFLAKTKRIILVPILYFFVTILFISVWLACMLCINSIGDIVPESFGVQNRNAKRTPEENKQVWMIFLFMFFGILWICAFIRAKTSFIAMVAATTYYFDSNENKEGDADVNIGFKFAYMYHAGSLAFGSLIIAIIQFLRIVVMTIAEQAQRASGDNCAFKIIVGCAKCCMKCIEKICDYINK